MAPAERIRNRARETETGEQGRVDNLIIRVKDGSNSNNR